MNNPGEWEGFVAGKGWGKGRWGKDGGEGEMKGGY